MSQEIVSKMKAHFSEEEIEKALAIGESIRANRMGLRFQAVTFITELANVLSDDGDLARQIVGLLLLAHQDMNDAEKIEKTRAFVGEARNIPAVARTSFSELINWWENVIKVDSNG